MAVHNSYTGTKNITAVDKHFGCIKYINDICKEFEFEINTIKNDGYKFIEKTTLQADVIFADPPYNFSDEDFDINDKQKIWRNVWPF